MQDFQIDSPLPSSQVQFSVYPKSSLNASNINHEEYRLRTFKSWPVQAPVQPERLAKAGFYYLGNGLEVICFSCGGRISDWMYGDIVMQKHIKLFPKCEFVNNRSNNVPLSKRVVQEVENQNGFPSDLVRPSRPGHSSSINTEDVSVRNTFGLPRQLQQPVMQLQQPVISPSHSRPTAPTRLMDQREFLYRMKYESERLRTFLGKWPLEYVSPSDLAGAGFFYLQVCDKVQCPFCFGVLTNWEPGDKPYVEHTRNFPTCPFITGRNVGNVPRGEDICGMRQSHSAERRLMPNSVPENRRSASVEDIEMIGVTLHTGPHHPSQASKDARLRSFLSWPQNAPVRGEELAEAGFFFIGLHDNVKCFSCDGGLNNWEPGDDPWVEHARWFPHCSFVKLNKGTSFINMAKRNSSHKNKVIAGSVCEQSFNMEPSAVHSTERYEENRTELSTKVNEAMKTNLVQSFLQSNAYPMYEVRQAITSKLQTTGVGVSSVDELCEAIHNLRSHEGTTVRMESGNEEEDMMALNGKDTEVPQDNKEDIMAFGCKKQISDPTLEEEIRQLKEQRMCKICMDQEVGVVFLPCGHLIACVQCAPALSDCALCRSPIKGTIRTFLS